MIYLTRLRILCIDTLLIFRSSGWASWPSREKALRSLFLFFRSSFSSYLLFIIYYYPGPWARASTRNLFYSRMYLSWLIGKVVHMTYDKLHEPKTYPRSILSGSSSWCRITGPAFRKCKQAQVFPQAFRDVSTTSIVLYPKTPNRQLQYRVIAPCIK